MKIVHPAWLALLVVGCGGAETTQGAFVTALDARLHLGVANDGARTIGYICDGTSNTVTIGGWFESEQTDGVLSAEVEGMLFDATLEDGTLEGTVVLEDGTALDFQTTAVDPEVGGLFRGEGSGALGDYVAGWILITEDNQRGALRNLSTGTSTPIEPYAVSHEIVSPVVDGEEELTLTVKSCADGC